MAQQGSAPQASGRACPKSQTRLAPPFRARLKRLIEAGDPAKAILEAISSGELSPDTKALGEALHATLLAGFGAGQQESVAAAAKDPAERIRIARLAARARWRGHVKQLKKKLQAQYGTYFNADGHSAELSSQFVDKAYSGTARKKSYLNGVPDLVHLQSAANITKYWSKAKSIGIQNSTKPKEQGKVKYGRYEAFFKKNNARYRALITSRIVIAENKEILYSIEIFKA